MEDNINNVDLELYKILNERVQKEIEEMYDVHRLHFLTVTALITVAGFGYDNPWLNIICGLAGIWYLYRLVESRLCPRALEIMVDSRTCQS